MKAEPGDGGGAARAKRGTPGSTGRGASTGRAAQARDQTSLDRIFENRHIFSSPRIYLQLDIFLREGVIAMPRGGARKGAGRKPRPLAEKLAAGNPGHRPLKKVEFRGDGSDSKPTKPPDYISLLEKRMPGAPTPIELYHETIKYLEPSDCMNLIPSALISDYVMAKYYLICAQFDLSKTATVIQRKIKNSDEFDYEITSFTEAMLKLQKNVLACWEPIWEIVSKNSERLVVNPEQDLIMLLVGGRQRKSSKGAASNEQS